jgi:O-antigen/teichoic acid export membrane protein
VLRLTRDSAIYALGAVAGKGVALILLPVLTRSLSRDDFGRLEVLLSLSSALIWALVMGLDRAALRLAFDDRVPSRQAVFGTWYVLATAVALPPAVSLVVLSAPISVLLFGDRLYAPGVALVGAISLSGSYEAIALTALRAEGRAAGFALVNGGRLVLNAVLVIAVIGTFGADVNLVMLAAAASSIAGGLLGTVLVRRAAMGRPARRAARALLVLGLPLAPAVVATWAAEFANRAIVLTMAGPTEVAYFGLGARAASLAGLAVGGLQLAWEPHAYGLGTSPDALQRIAHDARRSLVGVAAFVGAVALVSREGILLLSGPAYLSALPAVGFSLVAVLASALFVVTTTPSMLEAQMHDVGVATLVGIGIAVGATVVLASPYGAAGAAAGAAVGQLCAALLAAWLGRRRAALPFAWRPTGAVLIAAGVLALASTLVDAPWTTRVVMAAVFALVLLAEGSIGVLAGRLLTLVRA